MDFAFTPALESFTVNNRATVYTVIVAHGTQTTYYMFASSWGGNHGEWIETASTDLAWSYLTEKVPGLARHEGDKEGWIMALKEAGLEVFG